MQAKNIPGHEEDFANNRTDSNGAKHQFNSRNVDVLGETQPLSLVEVTPATEPTYHYYPEAQEKTAVVLHFTMGYLKGDIATLTRNPDHHVSTAYVLARSGTAYQLFEPQFWSYHLGPGAIGGNTAQSRRCIGIEISNIGPLKVQGDHLQDAYGGNYCTLDETQFYHRTAFRDYDYYATFNDGQYDQLILLLKYLTEAFNIPRDFLPENVRYQTVAEAAAFNGILSHVNFRKDKVDIGPAFDWARIVQGVAA
ncbi:MAG: N-acetylmuramoyl-L-alanine amidase [bacterium]